MEKINQAPSQNNENSQGSEWDSLTEVRRGEGFGIQDARKMRDEYSQKLQASERIVQDMEDEDAKVAQGGGLREGYFADRELVGAPATYRLKKNQIIQDEPIKSGVRTRFETTQALVPVEERGGTDIVDLESEQKGQSIEVVQDEIRKLRILSAEASRDGDIEKQKELNALLDAKRAELKRFQNGEYEKLARGEKEDQALLTGEVEVLALEEAKERNEAEEKERSDAENRERELREEYERNAQEIEKLEKQKQEELKKQGPLVVMDVNLDHDVEEMARDVAEREINKEIKEQKGVRGCIKRLWKNQTKSYYVEKRKQEYIRGERKINGEDGKEQTVAELVKRNSGHDIARFIGVATKEYEESLVHTAAGEKMAQASEQFTQGVKGLVMDYAGRIQKGEDKKKLDKEFQEALKALKSEARKRGEKFDDMALNNYWKVVEQAASVAEQGRSLDEVMDGFQVYVAEARDGVRTEVHRNKLDRAIHAIGTSKIGKCVPVLAVAGIATGVVAIGQSVGRSVAGAVLPVIGGSAVGAAMAAAKEHNKFEEDYARMSRDKASNAEYYEKKEKYEKQLSETLYSMERSTDLINNIDEALESGDQGKILQAVIEAKVRTRLSDDVNLYSQNDKKRGKNKKRRGADLISYSSSANVGEERMKLDIKIVEGLKALNEQGLEMEKIVSAYVAKEEQIYETIIASSDKKKGALRTKRMAQQALKAFGTGVAIGIISQEVLSFFNPNQIGLSEKLTGAGDNNPGASETFLASFVKETKPNVIDVSNISEADVAEYEQAGYKVTQNANTYHTESSIQEVKASDLQGEFENAEMKYANYGTAVSEKNELRLWTDAENGRYVSKVHGISEMADGTQIDTDKVKPSWLAIIGGKRFGCVSDGVDASGRSICGDGQWIRLANGGRVHAMDDEGNLLIDGLKLYVERTDGNLISIATEKGTGEVDTITMSVSEQVQDAPTFHATKVILEPVKRAVSAVGAIVTPFAPRKGIGGATPEKEEEEEEGMTNPTWDDEIIVPRA